MLQMQHEDNLSAGRLPLFFDAANGVAVRLEIVVHGTEITGVAQVPAVIGIVLLTTPVVADRAATG